MTTTHYYIGMMSGTSVDGIDASLVRIENDNLELLRTLSVPFSKKLRKDICDACDGTADRLHALMVLDTILADQYADAALSILDKHGLANEQVTAIGNHGQTVRHCPGDTSPYTLQLGNAQRIAALTGIPVVSGFRQADMAVGGQGAPLAPLFHGHMFHHNQSQVITAVNLGGIANISILGPNNQIRGHDTGPANTLMDRWIEKHLGEPFDRDGRWASKGNVIPELLETMLQEPWLKQPAPKSTGPELFNLQWLQQAIGNRDHKAEDVQRTLCEFSAVTLTSEIRNHAPETREIVLCGGGAYNPLLVGSIAALFPEARISTSNDYGIAPAWVESCMMAWLAHRRLCGLPGNVPAVTGASREMVLGAVFPAGI